MKNNNHFNITIKMHTITKEHCISKNDNGGNILLISGSNIPYDNEYGFLFDLIFSTIKDLEYEKYLKQIAWGFWHRINDVITLFLEAYDLTFDSFSKIYRDGDSLATKITIPNKGEIFNYLLFSTDSEIKTKRSIKLCVNNYDKLCKDHIINIKDHIINIKDDNLEDPNRIHF